MKFLKFVFVGLLVIPASLMAKLKFEINYIREPDVSLMKIFGAHEIHSKQVVELKKRFKEATDYISSTIDIDYDVTVRLDCVLSPHGVARFIALPYEQLVESTELFMPEAQLFLGLRSPYVGSVYDLENGREYLDKGAQKLLTQDGKTVYLGTIFLNYYRAGGLDKIRVLLHELTHALGFNSNIVLYGEQVEVGATAGYLDKKVPTTYDYFLCDGKGVFFLGSDGKINSKCDFRDLYFVDRNRPGIRVPIHLGSTQNLGQSFGHVDDLVYYKDVLEEAKERVAMSVLKEISGGADECSTMAPFLHDACSETPVEYREGEVGILESLGYRLKSRYSGKATDILTQKAREGIPVFVRNKVEGIEVLGYDLKEGEQCLPGWQGYKFLGYVREGSALILRQSGGSGKVRHPLPSHLGEEYRYRPTLGVSVLNTYAREERVGNDCRVLVDIESGE